MGKVRGPDGELIDGQHEPIISEELWHRAQARLAGGELKRSPGQHVQAEHVLVKGKLRCAYCCGPMLARKAERGRPERYFCRNRYEGGPAACPMPGIRRQRVDEPFLSTL